MKIATLALALILVGCGASTPTTPAVPVPPNSPQTQVLNITKTLADSINAAVKTAISLRDSGKIDQATTLTIENWAKSAAVLDDTIATELGSADPWPLQKQKILVILPAFRIPGTSYVNTTLQAALTAVGTILSQLQVQVAQ